VKSVNSVGIRDHGFSLSLSVFGVSACIDIVKRLQVSREIGLRDSELKKLEGRKDIFILYFIKTTVIRALRTACVHCAVVGGHWTLSMHHCFAPAPAAYEGPSKTN
jgi:hypothetical protein